MPRYIYRDDATGEERTVRHDMSEMPVIVSAAGNRMRRIIRNNGAYINWNGNRAVSPTHPQIRQLIETADERRDQYLERYGDDD